MVEDCWSKLAVSIQLKNCSATRKSNEHTKFLLKNANWALESKAESFCFATVHCKCTFVCGWRSKKVDKEKWHLFKSNDAHLISVTKCKREYLRFAENLLRRLCGENWKISETWTKITFSANQWCPLLFVALLGWYCLVSKLVLVVGDCLWWCLLSWSHSYFQFAFSSTNPHDALPIFFFRCTAFLTYRFPSDCNDLLRVPTEEKNHGVLPIWINGVPTMACGQTKRRGRILFLLLRFAIVCLGCFAWGHLESKRLSGVQLRACRIFHVCDRQCGITPKQRFEIATHCTVSLTWLCRRLQWLVARAWRGEKPKRRFRVKKCSFADWAKTFARASVRPNLLVLLSLDLKTMKNEKGAENWVWNLIEWRLEGAMKLFVLFYSRRMKCNGCKIVDVRSWIEI